MNRLSVVATPIGNLSDITVRALEVLRSVDGVIAEDTRVTKKLLEHYEIAVPMSAFHARSGEAGIEKVIGLLAEGKHLALVTDAGTPGISDPGSELIDRVRTELPDVVIEAIPGASAVTAALSIAGVPSSAFLFLGFLPHKKGRETLFAEIAASERTVVFYESPHRIEKTLGRLAEVLGEGKRVVVARELTKMYERVVRGSAHEVRAYFEAHPDEVRGEFVVMVA